MNFLTPVMFRFVWVRYGKVKIGLNFAKGKQFFFFSFLIRIGDPDHNSTSDNRFAKDLFVLTSSVHPNYNGKASYFDVAILKTETIEFNLAVAPGIYLRTSQTSQTKQTSLLS
jgi:hypothetical protein